LALEKRLGCPRSKANEPTAKSQELPYVCFATHNIMAKMTIGISAIAT
jgi:hypothetical protein